MSVSFIGVGLHQKGGAHHKKSSFKLVLKAYDHILVLLYEATVCSEKLSNFDEENIYTSAMVESWKS
jgi:hypothetical protein